MYLCVYKAVERHKDQMADSEQINYMEEISKNQSSTISRFLSIKYVIHPKNEKKIIKPILPDGVSTKSTELHQTKVAEVNGNEGTTD